MKRKIEGLIKENMTQPRWEMAADALIKVLGPKTVRRLGVKYIRWGDYHWRGYRGEARSGYIAHVDYIAKFFAGKTGRLLDVGCGDCLVMKRIEEESGLECLGIDASPLAIEYAHKHQMTNCKFVPFEEFNGDKYDFILFADVIEHLEDPNAALLKAEKLLTDDGAIFCSFPVFQKKLQPGDRRLVTAISAKELVERVFVIDLIHISTELFRMYISARKPKFAKGWGGRKCLKL